MESIYIDISFDISNHHFLGLWFFSNQPGPNKYGRAISHFSDRFLVTYNQPSLEKVKKHPTYHTKSPKLAGGVKPF